MHPLPFSFNSHVFVVLFRTMCVHTPQVYPGGRFDTVIVFVCGSINPVSYTGPPPLQWFRLFPLTFNPAANGKLDPHLFCSDCQYSLAFPVVCTLPIIIVFVGGVAGDAVTEEDGFGVWVVHSLSVL